MLVSCVTEVIIDLPVEQSKPIVYSTVVPFILPYPKTSSIQLFETTPLDNMDTVIDKEAQIKIYENDQFIGEALFHIDRYNYPAGFSPIIGKKYSIEIVTNKFDTLSAETIIPQKVAITRAEVIPVAYFDVDTLAVSEVIISFDDPENEKIIMRFVFQAMA